VKKHDMKIHNYTVILEPATGGGYNEVVPALPDIKVHGKTSKEAKELVTEIIECRIKELKANEPPPNKHLVEEALNISYLTNIKY
jgi:predicted RNase H-like HicB family nuclease